MSSHDKAPAKLTSAELASTVELSYYLRKVYGDRGMWWNGSVCLRASLPTIQAVMAKQNTLDEYLFFNLVLVSTPDPTTLPPCPPHYS